MTKKEIIRRISADCGIDQTLTRQIVQKFLDQVVEVLVEQGRLELRNFGVFEVKRRAPRKARNPKTNEQLIVPAKNALTFAPGRNLCQLLQQEQTPSDTPAR